MGIRQTAFVALVVTFAGLFVFGISLPDLLARGLEFWTLVRIVGGAAVGIGSAVVAIYSIETYYYLGGTD